ncbi:nuclear transport factor 2 family protein [Rhodococcus sp. NPDC049939]|uniref:nuclear transport factor 2 family protein n=1 Tax=Rhodococcus sp. NPDC049939 TaxID=3155511 RepID=UPI00340AD34E
MDLEAVAAISRLKYTYLRALDTKSWDEFAGTLLPDATASYGEHLSFDSRDALVEFMKSNLGPHTITEHHCGHPEIDVDGDTATGQWYLSDVVLIPAQGVALRGAAFYSDRYLRDEDGQWRIAHTGYERTYEAMMSLSDMPSFRLTSNRWAPESDSGNGAV